MWSLLVGCFDLFSCSSLQLELGFSFIFLIPNWIHPETTKDITPTIGFSSTKLNIDNTAVTFYDVGGGPRIRGIWKNYYSEVSQIIAIVIQFAFK